MEKIKNLSAALFCGWLGLWGTNSLAMEMKSDPIAVVELFTSQGCSSCPPADDYLAELSHRQDVITLAYHVDYWNYIGWTDTFSAKKHSDLQRDYARQNRREQIYTPQMILNGQKDYVGSNRDGVNKALSKSHLPVDIKLKLLDDGLKIDIPAQHISASKAIIWLVSFTKSASVSINRGENRGQVLSYSSIVHDRQIAGMWMGEKPTEIMMPVSQILRDDIDGLAVLVQEQSATGWPGKILGAASVSK